MPRRPYVRAGAHGYDLFSTGLLDAIDAQLLAERLDNRQPLGRRGDADGVLQFDPSQVDGELQS